jgi:GH15 family glucan-1,4-alpha-glucosidase
MTTFWLADNLALMGRRDEAQAIFDRLSSLQNDVGLFSEEYDPATGRMLGNFPQAFSHVAFITPAANLSLAAAGPAVQRRRHSDSAAIPGRAPE